MTAMMQGPSVGGLGYIGIGHSNAEEWARFAEIAGLMLGSEGPDGSVRYRVDGQAWRIALHNDNLDDCLYLGFDCGSADRLDAVVKRVRGAGLQCDMDEQLAQVRGVRALAKVTDPDGMEIELYFGALETALPFYSPQPQCSFKTGSQGLGHVIVNASDPDRSIAFYCDVLGLGLSDRILFNAAPGVTIPLTFLHCNGRHHTIAISPRMPESKRIHHMMLEVSAVDDVGLALDRMMAAGIEVTATLGRHTNDGMLSFYVRTPSGFELEYGCQGISVDRPDWVVVDHDAISVWGHHREKI